MAIRTLCFGAVAILVAVWRSVGIAAPAGDFELPFRIGSDAAPAFSPDSRLLATVEYVMPEQAAPQIDAATLGCRVRLWDVATGNTAGYLDFDKGGNFKVRVIMALAFSPDGKSLIAKELNTFHVWDVESRKHVKEFRSGLVKQGPTTEISASSTTTAHSLAYSPDGKFLAAATIALVKYYDLTSDTSRVLELTPGYQLGNGFLSYSGGISTPTFTGITFSADGRTLLCSRADGTFRALDVATGQPGREFGTPYATRDNFVRGTALSADGQLAAVANETSIQILESATGKVRQSFRVPATHRMTSLAFSPDNAQLAVAGVAGRITIHDAITGKLVSTVGGKSSAGSKTPPGKPAKSKPGAKPKKPPRGAAPQPMEEAPQPVAPMGEIALTQLAFSPDGLRLVGVENGMTVHIWNVPSHRRQQQPKVAPKPPKEAVPNDAGAD